MNKIFKGLIRFLIEVIVMTVLIVGINIFTNGMYLWGLPRINDIQSVNITYPSVTDDVKEISSSEDIELALKLTGFLKYDLFGEVNSEEEPAITITYFLKDGTSKTISANNTTVWWNNKIHVIKDKEMFVNLTEGIFFLEDLQTKEINSCLTDYQIITHLLRATLKTVARSFYTLKSEKGGTLCQAKPKNILPLPSARRMV